MHEFSIAEGLVQIVLDELRKLGEPPPKLLKVRIAVGVLQQVVPESLALAWECLTEKTPAAGSVIELNVRPVAGRCGRCGWSGELAKSPYFCPACENPRLEFTAGRELYLESLDVDDG